MQYRNIFGDSIIVLNNNIQLRVVLPLVFKIKCKQLIFHCIHRDGKWEKATPHITHTYNFVYTSFILSFVNGIKLIILFLHPNI